MVQFCTNWGQRLTYSGWEKFLNLHERTSKKLHSVCIHKKRYCLPCLKLPIDCEILKVNSCRFENFSQPELSDHWPQFVQNDSYDVNFFNFCNQLNLQDTVSGLKRFLWENLSRPFPLKQSNDLNGHYLPKNGNLN